MADQDDNYTPRSEDFEVVLLKNGISSLDAKPEDFARVSVAAPDPLSAMISDAARAKVGEGYQALFAAKPGVLTDPELQARSRQMPSLGDRSKM